MVFRIEYLGFGRQNRVFFCFEVSERGFGGCGVGFQPFYVGLWFTIPCGSGLVIKI